MAHTPGPWIFNLDNNRIRNAVVDRFHSFIATVQAPHFTYDKPDVATRTATSRPFAEVEAEFQANARLIAAAPDLLEALEEIRDADISLPLYSAKVRIIASRAIAKAKGETPVVTRKEA